MAPAIQLSEPNIVCQGALNGSIDDQYFRVTLPFHIKLYDVVTNSISMTSNGVSTLILTHIPYNCTKRKDHYILLQKVQ